jgi:hypothetical protein
MVGTEGVKLHLFLTSTLDSVQLFYLLRHISHYGDLHDCVVINPKILEFILMCITYVQLKFEECLRSFMIYLPRQPKSYVYLKASLSVIEEAAIAFL